MVQATTAMVEGNTMSERTVEQALAHAKVLCGVRGCDNIVEEDLVVLADEVARLRAESARLMDESDAVGFRRGVMSAENEIKRLRAELTTALDCSIERGEHS